MASSQQPQRQQATPFAYGVVLFLGAAMAPFLLSVDRTLSLSALTDFAFRRSLSNGSLYSLKDAAAYSNLQSLDDIDLTIEERAVAEAKSNASKRQSSAIGPMPDDKCSRVFLYLPDLFSEHGHGSQINTYIMGITASTYLDRPMVLVEPPSESSRYAGGSQFGCPVDSFQEKVLATSSMRAAGVLGDVEWKVDEEFPRGFSRLVDHPTWLHHGCPVPCEGQYTYDDWLAMSRDRTLPEVTCQNRDGTTTNVVAAGGSGLRMFLRDHEKAMVDDRPSVQKKRWAFNLGATPAEADAFNRLHTPREMWDYVLGLMNKAGFLKFQSWIARDAELFLKTFRLPSREPYSAIHVRRGDKLVFEARDQVLSYWRTKGYTDEDNLPTDYVPFAAYLDKWDGPEACPVNDDGERQVLKHNVYVATDDPVVVRQEITELPNHIDEDTVLHNECHELTFYFNPTDDSAFHLNGDGEHGFDGDESGEKANADSCFARYHRNIASVADMMILSKARTFIGEYNSNWGRVIRTMRVRLNGALPLVDDGEEDGAPVNAVYTGGLSKVLDTRIAWGPRAVRNPGY